MLQRNALSWMLHRELHGGEVMPHPFIKTVVTADGEQHGLPIYLNQVSRDQSGPSRDLDG